MLILEHRRGLIRVAGGSGWLVARQLQYCPKCGGHRFRFCNTDRNRCLFCVKCCEHQRGYPRQGNELDMRQLLAEIGRLRPGE